MLYFMIAIVIGLLLKGISFTAPLVSTRGLLQELRDGANLARLPRIPFKQLHTSSYDRSQTDPRNEKTWFANADYGQFIRTEQHDGKTEWVVMDHQGPGAITHIWTPLLGEKDKMIVRFYFDGAEKATIEEPFNDFMRGKGLIKPPFAFVSWPEVGVDSGVGSDVYFPIPYAKGCKVTLSELPFYYSFDYRAYSSTTTIQTFAVSDVALNSGLIKSNSDILTRFVDPTTKKATNSRIALQPDSQKVIRLPKGSSAVSAISLGFSGAHDDADLRSTIIEMRFDGDRTVWCPIGEFFGSGVHARPVWDRFRQVDETGRMICRWAMPYRHSAELVLRNLGKHAIDLNLGVSTEPWHWDSQSMHFHTTWRNQYPLATRPMSDWNYLEASGPGVYVGDTLTVFSPVSAWYGEGDERIYVDGESFPSHLGTGTEDYYGYAWGMAEHYSSAFLAMPYRDLKGRENWSGFTTTSRVRGLDAIPFEKSFKFDMEIWNWADCNVGYSATTFWYARPGAKSNREPLPNEAKAPIPHLN